MEKATLWLADLDGEGPRLEMPYRKGGVVVESGLEGSSLPSLEEILARIAEARGPEAARVAREILGV